MIKIVDYLIVCEHFLLICIKCINYFFCLFCLVPRFAVCTLNLAVMGNSTSAGFNAPVPKKLSRGRQRDDMVKLKDFLTKQEEDLWNVKGKQSLSVKRIRLNQSISYVDLDIQENKNMYPTGEEIINPAFIVDQAP